MSTNGIRSSQSCGDVEHVVKDWWFSRFSLDPTRCQPQVAPSSFDRRTLQTPKIIFCLDASFSWLLMSMLISVVLMLSFETSISRQVGCSPCYQAEGWWFLVPILVLISAVLMFFLTKAFADQVGNLVTKLEEVADKLVTSASISRPSQQLADLLRHLWSNVVLIPYYFLQWSNLVSLFLAPSNCPPRGRSCLQGWVRSSRWRFCPCCPSGQTPPRSSSPTIKFKFGQSKEWNEETTSEISSVIRLAR